MYFSQKHLGSIKYVLVLNSIQFFGMYNCTPFPGTLTLTLIDPRESSCPGLMSPLESPLADRFYVMSYTKSGSEPVRSAIVGVFNARPKQ